MVLTSIKLSKREYDILSVVKPGQSLVGWAVSVRIRLQELLANQRFSVYYRYCLFAGFGNDKMVNSDYHRPRINKSNMAICFDCWKLVKITDIKPKKNISMDGADMNMRLNLRT